jgi:outer membrane protein TolC
MRQLTVFVIFLLSLASPVLGVDAAQPIDIDLATTVQMTEQRALPIKSSQQNIVTATKNVRHAEGTNSVQVDLDASYYHLNDELRLQDRTLFFDDTQVIVPGETIANQDVFFANISAAYPLLNFGRIRYDIRRARYTLAETTNYAADTRLSTIYQVSSTYLAAVYGKENVRVNQESLRSYEEHLDQARKSRKEGTATDYDVIRAEAAVEDQRKRLTEVQNSYDLALANLRLALLLDKNTPINLKGNFFNVAPTQTIDLAEESAVRADPRLRGMESRTSALTMAEKSIRAEAYPQLDLVGFANIINRNSGFLTNPQWFVGVQLSQLIFDGGVVRARADEYRSERLKNEIDTENTANQVRLAMRSAYLDMSTAQSAIAASRKSVELARESLRLARRRFSEGVGTSLEVLDANVNLLSAETGLQQSLYQLDTAYLETHRYLGDIAQVASTAQLSETGGTR